MYYRGANAAIICYDITSASSWNMVDSWLQELRRNMTTKLGNPRQVPFSFAILFYDDKSRLYSSH
jgi:GTPase SAR1 family protein